MLQVGLYGVIGAAASPLLELWFGLSLPLWAIALAAWLIVGVLGLQQVDISGRVLAVLLCAEVTVILVFSRASLGNPAGGTVLFTTLVITVYARGRLGNLRPTSRAVAMLSSCRTRLS